MRMDVVMRNHGEVAVSDWMDVSYEWHSYWFRGLTRQHTDSIECMPRARLTISDGV